MARRAREQRAPSGAAAPPAAKESEIDDIMARFNELREGGDSRREPSSAAADGAALALGASLPAAESVPAPSAPPAAEAQVRRRMNNELNFPPNSEGLVLGCIDADFCK